MIDRKKAVYNTGEDPVVLYRHRPSRIYFSAEGRGLDTFIPDLERLEEGSHLMVLADVTLKTSFDFTEYTLKPVFAEDVERLIGLVNEAKQLSVPSIEISLDAFKAAFKLDYPRRQ